MVKDLDDHESHQDVRNGGSDADVPTLDGALHEDVGDHGFGGSRVIHGSLG